MKIWIDIVTAPQVSVMRPIVDELNRRGHTTVITTRDFAETVPLAEKAGLKHRMVGRHGGANKPLNAAYNLQRALALAMHFRHEHLDLAISHNSYSQAVAARMLGVPLVTMMDYEHRRANHIAFRLARKVLVPSAFPDSALRKYGADTKSVRYPGLKEELYLSGFRPDPGFRESIGVPRDRVLVVARPPAYWAGYYKGHGQLFKLALERIFDQSESFVIFLPRIAAQTDLINGYGADRVLVPKRPLDGPNVLYCADLVISAGGTMNREAAVLGTPAVTVFEGEMAAVDLELISRGRLQAIGSPEDIGRIAVCVKERTDQAFVDVGSGLLEFITNAILATD